MRVQYPIYAEARVCEHCGAENYVFMVPWKFELFIGIRREGMYFEWSLGSKEIEDMNDYIRGNKNKLHKIARVPAYMNYELDRLIEFFSCKQEDEGEVLRNIEDLFVLAGVRDEI